MIYYMLNEDKTIRTTEDALEWSKWFETYDRKVALDKIGDVKISTIFLGIDHSFGHGGPPVLFETMVFGGKFDQDQERYCTYDEALIGHKEMVEKVKNDQE